MSLFDETMESLPLCWSFVCCSAISLGFSFIVGCSGRQKATRRQERAMQIKLLPRVETPEAEEDAKVRHSHHTSQELPKLIDKTNGVVMAPKRPEKHPAVAPPFTPINWLVATGTTRKPPRCTFATEAELYWVPGLNEDKCRGQAEDDEETDPLISPPVLSPSSPSSPSNKE